MLQVAFFGSDSVLSLRAVEAVAAEHRVVGVVQAARRFPQPAIGPVLRTLWQAQRHFLGRMPLAAWAREGGIPHRFALDRNDPAVAAQLTSWQADIICVVTYRWILPAALFEVPRLGGVNLHPSLLPRHRGPWPVFWTYYHDDREAGLTVHRAVERADAGPVLLQQALPLPRGRPVADLYGEFADRAGPLLVRALNALETGTARPAEQDEGRATRAPRVPAGQSVVPFQEWDVERVWHFIGGLASHYREPLRDARGRPVRYREAAGYERGTHDRVPGTVERADGGWRLHALGGTVQLR
ncbi:MAG: methionyl-tRNA formyltransferase [Gemmatimonadales bacterium]